MRQIVYASALLVSLAGVTTLGQNALSADPIIGTWS